jgi:hypothetical protein
MQGYQLRLLDGLHVSQDFVIPKPQHLEALRLQPSGPGSIVRDLLLVVAAIYLNDHFSFKADKVDDILAHRYLSAKLAACQLTVSKTPPQCLFGIG